MMTQLRKDLQWRSPVETFSQSGIEPMGEGVQLALGVTRQGGPLGQALVRSPLCASIVGQCVAQQGGHMPELVREPVAAGTPRIRPHRMAVGQPQAQGLTFFDTHVRIACLGHATPQPIRA